MVMLLNRKQFRLILLYLLIVDKFLIFDVFLGWLLSDFPKMNQHISPGQCPAEYSCCCWALVCCVPTPGSAPYILISREPSFFLPFAVILARQTQTTSRQCAWLVLFQVTWVEKDVLSLILFWSVEKNPTEIAAKICLLLSSVCLYGSRCHKFWTLSTLDSYSHRSPATGVEYFPIIFRDMVLLYESWVRSLLSSNFMP